MAVSGAVNDFMFVRRPLEVRCGYVYLKSFGDGVAEEQRSTNENSLLVITRLRQNKFYFYLFCTYLFSPKKKTVL